MGTPAIVTFKVQPDSGKPDVHLRVLSDGYPSGIVHQFQELTGVADRVWAGEEIDFTSLALSNGRSVYPTEAPERASWTPFRYEVVSVNGRTVVTAFRHEVDIPTELEERLAAARQALEEVETEMRLARSVPTYKEIGSGDTKAIRKLGDGYDDTRD